jgi:hypothetical protein
MIKCRFSDAPEGGFFTLDKDIVQAFSDVLLLKAENFLT